MSHEVETAFYARVPAWHGLGVVTPKELTAAEALVTAKLDWQVERAPLYVEKGDGLKLVSSHVATVRDRDHKVLGVVGAGYQPIQNERMLTWAELLVDTGEAQFTTAGSLRGGRIVFACLEINREIHLPGGDEVVPYFVVASSHDGSHAMRAFTSPIRPECSNMLAMAYARKRSSFHIRHTLNNDWRLDHARTQLRMVMGYYDEFDARAQAMIAQSVTDREFEAMVEAIMPEREDATPRQSQLLAMARSQVKAYHEGPSIGEYRNTGWGAFNAVNEYELWGKGVKGSRAERQALRALNGDFPLTFKAEAFLARLN